MVIRSGESTIRIQANQDWHFGSLQEVLRTEVSKSQSEIHWRTVEPPLQATHEIIQER